MLILTHAVAILSIIVLQGLNYNRTACKVWEWAEIRKPSAIFGASVNFWTSWLCASTTASYTHVYLWIFVDDYGEWRQVDRSKMADAPTYLKWLNRASIYLCKQHTSKMTHMTLRKLHLKYNINVQLTKFYFCDVKWHLLQSFTKCISHAPHIFGN